MPRDFVFGNGHLLVNLDSALDIRDIYYPYVGQLNHVSGYRCRTGVWTSDAGFAWCGDSEWERELAYASDSSVSDCTLTSHRLGLTLRIRHGIAPGENIFFQRIAATNLWEAERSVRLFFSHDLRIDESDIGDTAFYHPYADAMIHHKRDRYLLFSGASGEASPPEGEGSGKGICHYACGVKEFGGAEGTWRDAEDGHLSGNAIAQGSVDSTIGFDLALAPGGRDWLRAWMTVGPDLESVIALHDQAKTHGVDHLLEDAEQKSREWVRAHESFEAEKSHGEAGMSQQSGARLNLDALPERVAALFRRSLLVIGAQIDSGGAIIASTDSDILQTARAHYAYVWPRDGALVAQPLDRLGLQQFTEPFFAFCRRVLEKSPLTLTLLDGKRAAALLHKYGPDGTMGASWHAWTVPPHGREVPIQEDGTALMVWAGAQHLMRQADGRLDIELAESLVLPGARFLVAHRFSESHLPLPSWDLWEERRGVHLYTSGAVVGGLLQAVKLCAALGEAYAGEAQVFVRAADETRAAMLTHFWDDERARFARTLHVDDATGEFHKDMTVDSCMFGAFAYGALVADHPKVAATMGAIGRTLWVKTGIGGLARYENDYYFRVGDHEAQDISRVPGNPWIICTLWLADWIIATAKTRQDLEPALDLIEWAVTCALPTGVLPEQIHPITYQPLSVAPLTWSHAQYLTSVMAYLDQWQSLGLQS